MNRLHLAKNGLFMEIGDIFYWQPAGDQPPDMDVLPGVHVGSIVTCDLCAHCNSENRPGCDW